MRDEPKRPNPLRCRVCRGQIEEGEAIGGELPDGTKWAEHADLSVCEGEPPEESHMLAHRE